MTENLPTVPGARTIEARKAPHAEGLRDGSTCLFRVEGYMPYVVSFLCEGDREWCQGHYYKTLSAAAQGYEAAVLEELRRRGGDEVDRVIAGLERD